MNWGIAIEAICDVTNFQNRAFWHAFCGKWNKQEDQKMDFSFLRILLTRLRQIVNKQETNHSFKSVLVAFT